MAEADRDGAFAATLASSIHLAKNLLFGISARLPERAESSPGGDALPDVRGDVLRVAGILSGLLELYKADRGELVLQATPVVVAEFVEELLLDTRCRLAGGVSIELDDACVPGLVWMFDRERLFESLHSAIDNALRHARCRVRLGIRCDREWLEFRVDDDGAGFVEGGAASPEGSQLGLRLASVLLAAHRRGGRQGELQRGNGSPLGGAWVTMRVP